MKRRLAVLAALSLFAAAGPVLAEDGYRHGAAHKEHDQQCLKQCAMQVKNCAQEVDSIHDRIRKLQVEINEKGAAVYTPDELTIMKRKLKEAREQLQLLLTS